MKKLFQYIFTFSLFMVTAIFAQEIPVGIQPDEIKWFSPPDEFADKAQGALLSGPTDQPGNLYTIRVKLQDGGLIHPHRHPDKRYITVLSGTLYAGRGEKVETIYTTQYPAGSFFTVPASYVHFSWAKDGDVIYQESGIGPTANELVSD